MGHWLDTFIFPNSIEYELKWEGKYGAKGEKRASRQKATPEQIKKQNQLNREKYVRRLIKGNFFPDDLWITLKYPKGKRKPVWEVKKDFSNFIERLRYQYKKRGHTLKYIYRMEVGKKRRNPHPHDHTKNQRRGCGPSGTEGMGKMWKDQF